MFRTEVVCNCISFKDSFLHYGHVAAKCLQSKRCTQTNLALHTSWNKPVTNKGWTRAHNHNWSHITNVYDPIYFTISWINYCMSIWLRDFFFFNVFLSLFNNDKIYFKRLFVSCSTEKTNKHKCNYAIHFIHCITHIHNFYISVQCGIEVTVYTYLLITVINKWSIFNYSNKL